MLAIITHCVGVVMAIVINIVTRVDNAGTKQAIKEITGYANKAAATVGSTSGSFIRFGRQLSQVSQIAKAVGKSMTMYVTAPIVVASAWPCTPRSSSTSR